MYKIKWYVNQPIRHHPHVRFLLKKTLKLFMFFSFSFILFYSFLLNKPCTLPDSGKKDVKRKNEKNEKKQ